MEPELTEAPLTVLADGIEGTGVAGCMDCTLDTDGGIDVPDEATDMVLAEDTIVDEADEADEDELLLLLFLLERRGVEILW